MTKVLREMGMLSRDGMKACEDNRYPDALFKLKMAVDKAGALKLPLHQAKIRNNMALVYQLDGRLYEARGCFMLALKLARESAGTESHLYRKILDNLAFAEQELAKAAA